MIFTAVVISLLFRTLDDDDDDEKANKKINATPNSDEELIAADPILATGNQNLDSNYVKEIYSTLKSYNLEPAHST